MKKLQHPQIIIPSLDIISIDQNDIKKYLGKIKLNKIKVAFFGSDNFVIPVLQALEQNFEVIFVVTALGSAIQMEAKKLGIPTSTPAKLDENFLGVLYNPPPSWDLIVVASYGKIIPQAILNIPKFGALNVHPSLLPKGRGPSPVPATILVGDKISGVTIIKMDEKVDHGPIVATRVINLTGQENFLFLINQLFQLGADLLVEIIPDYVVGKIKLVPQNHAKATFTKALKKEDGYFDINSPPPKELLDRKIRAYYPWPGVWTHWNNKIVKFLPSRHPESDVTSDEGSLANASTHSNKLRDSSLASLRSGLIAQNDKFLIQMEGKKAMPLRDFLNGYPDFPLKSITLDKK